MQHLKNIGLNPSALSLAGLLAACATDSVDLGGSSSIRQSLEVGARCVDSTIVQGDVFVATPDELEALRGCEAIRGDFTVMVYEGTELSPLASLREVSGAIVLGVRARPIPDEILLNPMGTELAEEFARQEAEAARSAEIVEAGWLESLHGLEALELAGQMILEGIAAPDLGALKGLRNLGAHPQPRESGFLRISEAKNLVDLRGLEGVAGIRRLRLEDNPSLQSLAGVELSASMDSVESQDSPNLTDLTALSSVESLEGFVLANTGVENLDALVKLGAGSITLIENPELSDVSGLRNLQLAPQILIMSNPKLESIPEIPLLGGLEELVVLDNGALRSISLNFRDITTTLLDAAARFTGSPPPAPVERREVEAGSARFEISDNPQLESLTFGGASTSALVLEVNHNAGLSGIDLGPLRSLNVLSIHDNAALSDVALRDIETVNFLSVVDNPNLDATELRNVKTFETEASGNADDPAP
jgi:hypothetical protein